MKHKQTWDLLAEALSEIVYTRDVPPDGERFIFERDDESNYAVLFVRTYNPNTYHPERMRTTHHEFVVPVATYRKQAWTRWVFDKIASIEHHETCESFQIPGPDGVLYRPYAPHHGRGEDPYAFWPGGTAAQKALPPDGVLPEDMPRRVCPGMPEHYADAHAPGGAWYGVPEHHFTGPGYDAHPGRDHEDCCK